MPTMPEMFRPAQAKPRDEQRRDFDRRRDGQAWRRWYKTARWQKLARRIYLRDNYTCQVTGEILTGKAPAPNSAVADHIIEHDGDPDLFWDEDNIRCVSKRWHDGERQREQRAARRRGGVGQKSRTSRS